MRRLCLTVGIVACLAASVPAIEAEEGAQPSRLPLAPGATVGGGLLERPENWGPNPSILRIPAAAFFPVVLDNAARWASDGLARYRTGGTSDFGAAVHLPSGALILGIELDAVDQSSLNNMTMNLLVGSSADGQGLNYGGPGTAGSAGQQTLFTDLTSDHLTVDNVNNIYEIDVDFAGSETNALRLASVAVFYRLQVSQPLVQTFNDVSPVNPIYQYVEALAASGITGGCGGSNFCPNSTLTRGQMAVFLAKALGLYFE
jgi:hypothetical protein